jgi:hypothetical protein
MFPVGFMGIIDSCCCAQAEHIEKMQHKPKEKILLGRLELLRMYRITAEPP